MNLFKIYAIFFTFLLLCTLESDGILITLLLKLIALKGALFIGTPIALGSFVIGQGIGFLAGNLAGGYTVLKTAQKYHAKEKERWVGSPISYGWQGPKYTKGFKKGFSIGSLIAEGVNKLKSKEPSYHDYYGHFQYGAPMHYHYYSPPIGHHEQNFKSNYFSSGGYDSYKHDDYSSGGYKSGGYPGGVYSNGPYSGYKNEDYSHISDYISNGGYSNGYSSSYPANSYAYGYTAGNLGNSYNYPSYASSYYTKDPHVGISSKNNPSFMERLYNKLPSFITGKNEGAQPNYVDPYLESSYTDGSYSSDFNSYNPQNPMQVNYPYKGTHLPGEKYRNPESEEFEKETILEDSEYTYSNSPYAQPVPKENNYHSKKSDTVKRSYSTSAPNFVLEKYLEKKLEEEGQRSKDSETKKEAKALIALLRKAYLTQLAESLKNQKVKSTENSSTTTEKSAENAKKAQNSVKNETKVENSDENESYEYVYVEEEDEDPLSDAEFVPISTEIFEKSVKNNRRKREGKIGEEKISEADSLRLLHSFMDEIKQFFTLVSALDQDTCLQKMVCDVHAREKKGGGGVTTYESNMISTFRIMDAIIPFDPSAPEDSSTKYRLASKIGELGASEDTCQKYYSACTYSTNQIINLGNQVELAGSESAVHQESIFTTPPQHLNIPNSNNEKNLEKESVSMTVSSSSSSYSTSQKNRRHDGTVQLMPRV